MVDEIDDDCDETKWSGSSVSAFVRGGEQPPSDPKEAHQRPARPQLRVDEPHAAGGSVAAGRLVAVDKSV